MRKMVFLFLPLLVGAQEIFNSGTDYSFAPGKGKNYTCKLDPAWGVLTLRGQMKTTGVVPGKQSWQNGRITMCFVDAKGKMVGAWPNVFGFEGTRDWTDCVRDYVIPEEAVALRIGLSHLGVAGTVDFRPISFTVKRNRATNPCNAALPAGAPANPWDLSEAWQETTERRHRICLNGLWGVRPVLKDEDVARVPGATDNWGWGKIPAIWGSQTSGVSEQKVWFSDWFEDHGVKPILENQAWYCRDIVVPASAAGRRIVLTFTMLNTRVVVYVDGARAAEVVFPGGEAEITSCVKPGQRQRLALYVTAYPLNQKTLDFNAPDRAVAKKAEVKLKGVTGDVYLDVLPPATRLVSGTVETHVKAGTATFVATGAGLGAGTYRLEALVRERGQSPVVRRFVSSPLTARAEGTLSFTAAWADAKRWDTHTPENLYTCELRLLDAQGNLVDAALPFTFGFREVRVQGRELLLNEVPIHLRALYNRTSNASAGIACRAAAQEMCRRLKSEGYNYIIAGNYNYSPGAIGYLDALLEACDEAGLLFSYSLPHIRDFDLKLDDPLVEARYRALTQWAIERVRNHPCVISYAMNHNATGYTGDMNPLRIDGKYDVKDQPGRRFRNRALARKTAALARSIDATRPIYHHESGNLDDFHTVNIYLNWAPVQERSDWLQHWSEEGVKPLFFVEWGMPHISSWSSYRGPLFIWRNKGYQSLWASEFAAALRGDAAYEGDTPETVAALAHEENLWTKGEPFNWGQLNRPLQTLTNNYFGVQATYMKDNWRSHRAWGITAMLPWDQGAFHVRTRPNTVRENPEAWKNLNQPGIVPDVLVSDSAWETGCDVADAFTRTCIGETLFRWNQEDCAFIGGEGVFTDKRHHFRPCETVRKTLIVLNDRRVPQQVAWTCSLKDKKGTKLAQQTGTVPVPPGGRVDVPVTFDLPDQAGTFTLAASFTFAGGKVQTDTFALEAYTPVRTAKLKMPLYLYDTKGLTAKEFERLGIAFVRTDCAQPWTNAVCLVVGRESLTRDLLDRVLVPAARLNSRILIFEQDRATLDAVGFRTQEYALRNAFLRYRQPWFVANEAMLRDWNGESTLVTPYHENLPEVEATYHTQTWCGFEARRVWRCRTRGAVASVIPEKPTVGDWKAFADGGFDLQYAPLLEWTINRGRIVFCQFDVTARTQTDPVADDLVNRLVARLEEGHSWPRRPRAMGTRAWILGRDWTTGLNEDFNVPDSGVYLVSSGAKKTPEVDARVKNGGAALCLGFSAAEVAQWSPIPLAMATTNGCYAARIEALPKELNGLSNADWQWHGAQSFDAFTERVPDGNAALRVVPYGKGVFVFWQVPPWKIDAEARPYLRTSRRRAEAMLSRLMGNLGISSLVEKIRYADVPIAEDDPYRYYRW